MAKINKTIHVKTVVSSKPSIVILTRENTDDYSFTELIFAIVDSTSDI
jgi:hypothetical protein